MSDLIVTGNAKADHAKAARVIIDLFDSQRRNAYDLGKAAWSMGLKFGDNPFDFGYQQPLMDAWTKGMQTAREKAQGSDK
jgi:hypothetical protein